MMRRALWFGRLVVSSVVFGVGAFSALASEDDVRAYLVAVSSALESGDGVLDQFRGSHLKLSKKEEATRGTLEIEAELAAIADYPERSDRAELERELVIARAGGVSHTNDVRVFADGSLHTYARPLGDVDQSATNWIRVYGSSGNWTAHRQGSSDGGHMVMRDPRSRLMHPSDWFAEQSGLGESFFELLTQGVGGLADRLAEADISTRDGRWTTEIDMKGFTPYRWDELTLWGTYDTETGSPVIVRAEYAIEGGQVACSYRFSDHQYIEPLGLTLATQIRQEMTDWRSFDYRLRVSPVEQERADEFLRMPAMGEPIALFGDGSVEQVASYSGGATGTLAVLTNSGVQDQPVPAETFLSIEQAEAEANRLSRVLLVSGALVVVFIGWRVWSRMRAT